MSYIFMRHLAVDMCAQDRAMNLHEMLLIEFGHQTIKKNLHQSLLELRHCHE